MSNIIKERVTANIDGDFVVFLIGFRVNTFWKIHQWWPVASAMPKMLKELYQNPELGFISHEGSIGRTSIMIQYWRSYDQLEAYAKSKTAVHLPAWARFNKRVGSNGDVGIWHETYIIKNGQHESIYNNMPKFGLGKVGDLVSVTGKNNSARDRLKNGVL